MSKIKIKLDNPEVAAIWQAVVEAKKRVAARPAWKQGKEFSLPSDVFELPPDFFTPRILKNPGDDYMGDIARYANLELD